MAPSSFDFKRQLLNYELFEGMAFEFLISWMGHKMFAVHNYLLFDLLFVWNMS
jgi:hypothetical protein